MSYPNDLSDIVGDCIKIFNENIDVLSDMGCSLGSELEDSMTLVVNKTELIDMAHEVANSVRIRNAESSFMRRRFEQDYT